MRLRAISCMSALVLGACNPKTTESKAQPQASAPAPAPSAPATAPTPATPSAPATAVDAAAPATAAEDWLLWRSTATGTRTQWLELRGDVATELAAREGIIVGADTALWRLEPREASAPVGPCQCPDEASGEDDGGFVECKPTTTHRSLGLDAVPLAGGAPVSLVTASNAPFSADDFSESLTVVGSAGATVFVSLSSGGYLCGAHGMVEGSQRVVDLATGADLRERLATLRTALPQPLRRQAADEIAGLQRECDAVEPATAEDALRDMALGSVQMAVVGGAPVLSWSFESDLPYVCSPDYLATGVATSDLLPEAAPLGLGGPLPKGLRTILASTGTADAFGFGKLSLRGAEREAALQRFRDSPQVPLPPLNSELSSVPAAGAAAPTDAQAAVKKGRDATRGGDYPGAVAAFDAAIEADKTLATAWSGRGFARLQQGQLDLAKADFERALELDDAPHFAAAVKFNLGTIAAQQGDTKAARAAYEASLALRDVAAVREALAQLDGKAP